MPNEPAWPARPEPSSYAHTGVGGRLGCSRRRISRWENAYRLVPLGVATTIPLPGTGTGSRNFLSPSPASLSWALRKLAARPRCAAGMASTAPAPTPYCRNCLRVVPAIVFSYSAIRATRTDSHHEPLWQPPSAPERGAPLLGFFCVSSMALVSFDRPLSH